MVCPKVHVFTGGRVVRSTLGGTELITLTGEPNCTPLKRCPEWIGLCTRQITGE